MTTKHTQGDWVIKTPNNSHQIIDSEFGMVATISHPYGDDEAEANAKLIAAAPALLQALEFISSYASMRRVDMDSLNAIAEQCEKVIKQATE